MASFRTGFKIFGEISLKQGLGRIRSFSEDRKPGQWLPEDQWAVRQPGSTCPEPCDKPRKPPKPSRSWFSVCKDPEVPIECDVRHSNCPPPPSKDQGPWYSLDKLIPKKKHEKPPPLQSCREEMKRREMLGEEEEVCENIVDKTLIIDIKPEFPESCMPKQEPCPAPVVTLSCPLPKELDIMLWCGRPSRDTSRIAAKCQSDRLPYQEFRPQKCWKPPPFSLPCKTDASYRTPSCCSGSIPYAEFKQVDVPKPLYTRYKSVELCDANFMLAMTDATCPREEPWSSLAIAPPPPSPPVPFSCCCENRAKPDEAENHCPETCPEKPIVKAGSCRPVRIKKAPKYTFRPKPTKLIERRVYKNPCAQHKNCNLPFRPQEESEENNCTPTKRSEDCEPPKVLTGTLTDEPQTYERDFPCNPPRWMYVLCKPGSKETPLVPNPDPSPEEPDWCSETDGLKFYDGEDGCINPKPGADPCVARAPKVQQEEVAPPPPEPVPVEEEEHLTKFVDRFVLMPEEYNIKKMRFQDPCAEPSESEPPTLEKFIEVKTAPTKKRTKSYPPIKENILYDLQRLCPNPPLNPAKLNAPCRKPPEPDCPRPPRFYRSFSTFSPSALRNLGPIQFCKILRRTECGDSSGKCKVKRIVPKDRECPEKKTSKKHLVKYVDSHNKEHYASRVKCSAIKIAQNSSGEDPESRLMLGLNNLQDDSVCEYEQRPVVQKRKRNKTKMARKPNQANGCPEQRRTREAQANDFLLQEQAFKGHQMKSEVLQEEEETSLTILDPPEQNEDNSKALIGSIGSWINDLFHVPNKRSHSLPARETRNLATETLPDENSEYFKSIKALKEQFRKKLKQQTSIYIFPGEKIVEFNFNKISEGDRKGKKSLKALSASDPGERVEELFFEGEDESPKTGRENVRPNRKVHLAVRKIQHGTFLPPETSPVHNLSLVKQKKEPRKSRSKTRDLEEYVFPKKEELTKRLLLNINDHDKCSQLYKNPHLGMQEVQLYSQRKGKSCQSNARCYTTEANLIEEPGSKSGESNKFKGSCLSQVDFVDRGTDETVLNKKSFRNKMARKSISGFSRGSSTYVKVKSPKPPTSIHLDSKRNELKSSSDELVKYLMKKIKVTGRPQPLKKKTSALAPVVTNKNRIMQSATNSLVVSVMSKKENEGQFSPKNGSRMSSERQMKNDLLNKPSFPHKEWAMRYKDSNIRTDIKKAVMQCGFNRNSYLADEDKVEDEICLHEKPIYKTLKKQNEDTLKREMKECSEKVHKRQEVKNMLSSLDVRSNVYRASKVKVKEQKKMAPKSAEGFKISETKEAQMARFKRQHELFKNNVKTPPQNSDAEFSAEATEKENESASPESSSPSKELTVIDTDLQFLADAIGGTEEAEKAAAFLNKVSLSNAEDQCKVSDIKVIDCLPAEENFKSEKGKYLEKQSHVKEKLYRTKSMQFIKEEDTNPLLSPLSDYCNNEVSGPKEGSKVYEPSICSSELRPVKSLDTVLLNRRYSTNSLNDSEPQPPNTQAFDVTLFTDDLVKNSEQSKTEIKDKKKEKVSKNTGTQEVPTDDNCTFKKVKKIGPRCETDDGS